MKRVVVEVVTGFLFIFLSAWGARAEVSPLEYFQFQRSNAYEAVVRRLISVPEGETEINLEKEINRGDFPASLFPVPPDVRQYDILSGKKKIFQLIIDKPAQRDRLYDVAVTPLDATGLHYKVLRTPHLDKNGKPLSFPTTTAAQILKSISEGGGKKWIVAYTQPGVYTPVYASQRRVSEEFAGAVLYDYVYFNQGDATHRTLGSEGALGNPGCIGTTDASGGCSRLPAVGAATIRKAVVRSGESREGFQQTRYQVIETLDTFACENKGRDKFTIYLTPDRTLARIMKTENGREELVFSATDGYTSWLVTNKRKAHFGAKPTSDIATRTIQLSNRSGFDWSLYEKYKVDLTRYKEAEAAATQFAANQTAEAVVLEKPLVSLPKPEFPQHRYKKLTLVDLNAGTPRTMGTEYSATLSQELMIVKPVNKGDSRSPKMVVAGVTDSAQSHIELDLRCTNVSLAEQRAREAQLAAEVKEKADKAASEARAKRGSSSSKSRRRK